MADQDPLDESLGSQPEQFEVKAPEPEAPAPAKKKGKSPAATPPPTAPPAPHPEKKKDRRVKEDPPVPDPPAYTEQGDNEMAQRRTESPSRRNPPAQSPNKPAKEAPPIPVPQQQTTQQGASTPKPQYANGSTTPAAAVEKPQSAHPDMSTMLSVPTWIRLHPLLGAYLAESIGTFVFVLTIALVEINNPVYDGRKDTNVSSIPIGFMLMCMVLTFGYISGGHLNPAVTAAVFMYERKNMWRSIMYVICQCGSSLAAGIVAMIIKGSEDIIVPDVNNNLTQLRKGFFAELIYTFALATVVLNVSHRRAEPSVFLGMAVGMTITAGAGAVGGVSGGAFNPAVATGLQVAVCFVGRCTAVMHFWMYWLAPLAGAGLAALVFSNLYQPPENGDAAMEEGAAPEGNPAPVTAHTA